MKITDFDISKALFEGAAAMTCAGTTIYMVSLPSVLFLLYSFTPFFLLILFFFIFFNCSSSGTRSIFRKALLDRGRCVVVRNDDDRNPHSKAPLPPTQKLWYPFFLLFFILLHVSSFFISSCSSSPCFFVGFL